MSHQVPSTGSQWLQMAPNSSKLIQITMTKANGYGNGPTLSQMVPNDPNDPKLSIMIQHIPKWSNMVPECLKWSQRIKNGRKMFNMALLVFNGPKWS